MYRNFNDIDDIHETVSQIIIDIATALRELRYRIILTVLTFKKGHEQSSTNP